MVGEQTEYEVKTLTNGDRDLMTRKRKLSARESSASTSSMGELWDHLLQLLLQHYHQDYPQGLR